MLGTLENERNYQGVFSLRDIATVAVIVCVRVIVEEVPWQTRVAKLSEIEVPLITLSI